MGELEPEAPAPLETEPVRQPAADAEPESPAAGGLLDGAFAVPRAQLRTALAEAAPGVRGGVIRSVQRSAGNQAVTRWLGGGTRGSADGDGDGDGDGLPLVGGAGGRVYMLQRQKAPPAAPAQAPGADQQAAYDQAVMKRVDPLPDGVKGRLASIIGDAEVYGKIVERDEKTKQKDKDLEAWQGGTARGRNEHTDALLEKIKTATADIERLDAEIKAALPALGVSDEDELLERVEEEFPAIWIGQAKEIAYSMLEENAQLVVAESNRYASSMSTPDGSRPNAADIDGLRAADRELIPADVGPAGSQPATVRL